MKFLKLLFFLFVVILFNSCKKEYSNENLIDPIGSWEFTNAGANYSGYLDAFHTSAGIGSNTQVLTGKTFDNSETFELKLLTDSLRTGLYKASQFQCSFSFTRGSTVLYKANGLIGEFIVDITAIDSTHLTGTFSGTAADQSNKLVQITKGQVIIQ